MRQKILKYCAIVYVLLLIGGIFYVRGVLLRKDVIVRPIYEDEPAKKAPEVFKSQLLFVTQKDTQTFSVKLDANNSPNDLLDSARLAGFVYYELAEYTDKIEILVDNVVPPKNLKWELFENDKIVTNEMRTKNLLNGAVYTLKQVAVE